MTGLKGVVIHLGDWAVENMALSVTERGAKFDLIVFYLKNGHAISEDDCAGLARGYTAKERAAQKRVLEKFFVLKDGFYFNDWCELKLNETKETKQNVEEVSDVSEQRRAAAKARWDRERAKKSNKNNGDGSDGNAGRTDPAYANTMQNDADAYANADANGMQNDADALHTSTQYPVTSTQKEKDSAQDAMHGAMQDAMQMHMQNGMQTVAERDSRDDLFDEVPPVEEVPEDIKAQGQKQGTRKAASKKGTRIDPNLTLSDEWRQICEEAEPELDPDLVFANFKNYWQGESGQKATKVDWTATWRNNVASYRNAPDWKRNPYLKKKITTANSPTRKWQSREKDQSERDYTLSISEVLAQG